jgi:hypothetical protein
VVESRKGGCRGAPRRISLQASGAIAWAVTPVGGLCARGDGHRASPIRASCRQSHRHASSVTARFICVSDGLNAGVPNRGEDPQAVPAAIGREPASVDLGCASGRNHEQGSRPAAGHSSGYERPGAHERAPDNNDERVDFKHRGCEWDRAGLHDDELNTQDSRGYRDNRHVEARFLVDQ